MKIQIIRLSLVFGIAFFLASCDFLKEEETQLKKEEQKRLREINFTRN